VNGRRTGIDGAHEEMARMIRTRRKDGERGAVAVEFAIIFPLLAMMLFGIIQFGIAFSQYEVYTGAAREGARYAATRCAGDPDFSTTGCTAGMISSKVTAASVGYGISPGTPSASIVCSGSTIGQNVTVSWSQNITISIPFWKAVTVSRLVSAVFRCE
jgi:Flp pilus assembly protein TadG